MKTSTFVHYARMLETTEQEGMMMMMTIDQDDLYNDDDDTSLDDQGGGQVVPEVGDQLPAAARAVGHLQLLEAPQLDQVREAARGQRGAA